MLLLKKPLKQKKLFNIKGVKSLGVLSFIEKNSAPTSQERKAVLAVDNKFSIENLSNPTEYHENYTSIINLRKANAISNLTSVFCAVNNRLEIGGRFFTCVETSDLRKERLYKKFPKGINTLYYLFDFIGKRVAPKLPIVKKVYFFITAGRNRVLTTVEVLGRLAYCGFKIVDTKKIDNQLYIACEKAEHKVDLPEISYGVFFRMNRTGLNGKTIKVYKIRTMHAYAEHLQDHIYQTNSLAEGGKFKDDYRINLIGKLCRKFWIDELPMIYNVLKGDLKIVGVRPLSKQYMSLYTQNVVTRRNQFKPGLIPPFYADMPNTLDEIMASEMKYFDAYEKNPLATDISYFFKALKNILIKKQRSK